MKLDILQYPKGHRSPPLLINLFVFLTLGPPWASRPFPISHNCLMRSNRKTEQTLPPEKIMREKLRVRGLIYQNHNNPGESGNYLEYIYICVFIARLIQI